MQAGILQAATLCRNELTIQGVLQQYEEGPDKLEGFCRARDAVLLCMGLHATALLLIQAKCRIYDVQLPFARLTHDSYQLYAIHLHMRRTAFWRLQCPQATSYAQSAPCASKATCLLNMLPDRCQPVAHASLQVYAAVIRTVVLKS